MLDRDLTKNEQTILSLLMDYEVLHRNRVIMELYGLDNDMASRIKTRAVDQAITRLRKKIPDCVTIKSIRGIGYKLLVG